MVKATGLNDRSRLGATREGGSTMRKKSFFELGVSALVLAFFAHACAAADLEKEALACFGPVDEQAVYEEALGKTGRDTRAVFEFVRDKIRYECYPLSLRGGTGAICAGAGNSLDKSELLVGLLRKAGYEARLAQGTLDETHSRELVLSMFDSRGRPKCDWDAESAKFAQREDILKIPEPARAALIGALKEMGRPGETSDLIATARDHWWVELKTKDGWSTLDPSFARAKAGENYCEPTARHDALPAEMNQELQFAVQAVYRDGQARDIFRMSQPVKALSLSVITVRYEVTGEGKKAVMVPVVSIGTRSSKGDSAPLTAGEGNALFEIRFSMAPVPAQRKIGVTQVTLWRGDNSESPLGSCESAVVVDTGGTAAYLCGVLKKRFDGMNPLEAARPKEGMLAPLLKNVQQETEQRLSAKERTARRAVSDALMAAGFATRCLRACKVLAETAGAVAYADGARVTVASCQEGSDGIVMSLQISGSALRYVPSASAPRRLSRSLPYDEAFLIDAIRTDVLEKTSGSKVPSFTNVMKAARTQGISVKAFSGRDIAALDSLPLSKAARDEVRQRVAKGAIVLAAVKPVAFEGRKLEAFAVLHSISLWVFDQERLRSRLEADYALLRTADANAAVRAALGAGIYAYSVMEVADSLSEKLPKAELDDFSEMLPISLDCITSLMSGLQAVDYLMAVPGSPDSFDLVYDFLLGEVTERLACAALGQAMKVF